MNRKRGTSVLYQGYAWYIDSDLDADQSYTLRSLDGKSITVAPAIDLVPAP
jgi:hypothetical protein